eukprot:g6508.t2
MSYTFERSLRGAAPSSSMAAAASSAKPAKKKSVRWNDDEALSAGGRSENAVLGNSTGANAAGGGGPLGSFQEQQSIDHLRVPTKPSASSSSRATDTAAHHHHSAGSAAGGGLLASARKRVGEQRGVGIQGGAMRVRTPAKQKRPRADATPYRVTSAASAPHNYLRRGAATAGAPAVTSPRRSPTAAGAAARRPRSPVSSAAAAAGAATAAPAGGIRTSPGRTSPGRTSPRLHHSRSPRAAAAAAAAAPRLASTTTPTAAGGSGGSSLRQRRMSSSQALRSVAGGTGEEGDDAEATFIEDDDSGGDGGSTDFDDARAGNATAAAVLRGGKEHDGGDGGGGGGDDDAASSAEGPSPMSLLSSTLSAIGIAAGAAARLGGKPPRSPRAGKGSPTASFGGSSGSARASPRESPRALARAARAASPPFDVTGGLAYMQEEDHDDQDEEFPLGVARQSLDSRLAAAAAASSSLAAATNRASVDSHRASVDNLHRNSNNGAASLSPYTKSTTVRRTSTSLISTNGEPSSFVSEEVSEESSVTVTSAACGCQHEPGCAIGGQLPGPASENNNSVEVWDRLKELQGRTSVLEQEKVNLTLALVPLEERLQAKERAWEAERRELLLRSEAGLRSAKVAEDRCREVERSKSEMEEERHSLDAELRRLRGEIEQRESKTAASFWQRTVAADREKTRLENALDQAEARVVTLNKEKSELEAELLPIQSEKSSLKFRVIEAEKVASRVLTAEERLRFSETQLEVLKSELAATSAQLTAVQTELAQQKAGARKQLEEKERKAGDDLSNLRKEMQRLQETICSQADRVVAASMSDQAPTPMDDDGERAIVATQEAGAVQLTADAALSSEAARIRQQELSSLRSQLEASQERTRLLERQVEEGEEERRRMHNQILDLAGSVRVYVRARPFLKSDGVGAADEGAAVVRCGADASSIAVLPPDAPSRAISCAFDRVFGGHASQEDVFKEVSGFVQSALDGYKVCLFSYGQTGSGKTHTMTGSGRGMMRGIVPRAVEHILGRVGELQTGPWQYSVQASFLEIYNEELRDLLVGHGDVDAAAASPVKLSIKKSAGGGTEVAGLTKYDIDTGDEEQGLLELEEIMRVAQRTRSVASTAMNAESSRSHSVFTLWLTGVDSSTGTTLKGVLHLVDLAGSERLDRSGAGNDAQRLRETQAINKSLSCLADVFAALSAKASHVPFRNSKLTYLMQDCLSGDGKALMFVNLSPTAASANETVCSLRFANQVSQVQLGKATRQLSLSKPAGSSRLSLSGRGGGGGGGGLSSPRSPTRSQGGRAARASGSAASTAPPSPRSSQGGSFGLGRSSTAGAGAGGRTSVAGGAGGRTSVGRRSSSRLSSSSSTASPPGVKVGRGGVLGAGGVAARAKRPSLTGGARMKGTGAARGSVGAGRTSMGGSRLPKPSSARSRGSGEGPGGGTGAGDRRTSGSTRPSSAISKSLPPSPKPSASEKRLRLSNDGKRA